MKSGTLKHFDRFDQLRPLSCYRASETAGTESFLWRAPSENTVSRSSAAQHPLPWKRYELSCYLSKMWVAPHDDRSCLKLKRWLKYRNQIEILLLAYRVTWSPLSFFSNLVMSSGAFGILFFLIVPVAFTWSKLSKALCGQVNYPNHLFIISHWVWLNAIAYYFSNAYIFSETSMNCVKRLEND